MAIDFANDISDLYINGEIYNNTELRKLRPMNAKLSEQKDLSMLIRIGHYYFDNKPLIGKIVNVNVWSR